MATSSADSTAITTSLTTAISLRDDNTSSNSKNENDCSNRNTGKTGDSPNNINHNPISSDETNKDLAVVMNVMEDADEMAVRDNVTSPNTNANSIANGATGNVSSTLQDGLITL